MSKNVGVFVDVANLYYAAKSAGVDVDYVTLLKGAVKGRDLIRAYAYSGLDPENENQRKFIEFLSKNGYKVVHKDIRKYGDGKIKANLDIELVVDLFRLADRMDVAVVVSGDGDFAPAIRALQDKGVRGEVISFRGNTSSDLIAVADEFIDIMKIVEVGRTKKDAVAPAMPAKEVTPEFSFREAPASVAAAARAAMRTGRSRPAAARRGEPPAVTAPAIGSEAEVRAAQGEIPFDEEELVPTAGEPPEGRTRRRRRGGRGRGRGGATDGEAADREPGADEFDALSDIEDMSEAADYSFREADEATLAELGLVAPDVAASPTGGNGVTASTAEGDGADAPRKRTRRGRRGGRGRRRPEDGELQEDARADDAAPVARAEPGADAGTLGAATEAEPQPDAGSPPPTEPTEPAGARAGRAPRALGTRRPRAAAEASVAPGAMDVAETTDASATGAGEPARPRAPRRTRSADASREPAESPRPRRGRKPASAEPAESGEPAKPAPVTAPRKRAASGGGTRRGAARSAASSGSDTGGAEESNVGQSPQRGDGAPGEQAQPRGIWQRLLSGRRQ